MKITNSLSNWLNSEQSTRTSVIVEARFSRQAAEQEKSMASLDELLTSKGIQFNRIESACAFVFDACRADVTELSAHQDVEVIRLNQTRYV